ncbi:hypothetical protein BDF19DRAFT_412016 [Syncephalis fuscata]|nr:hypothetical protein BDF19DRAFT_412016 [Syncephalis fuscata]
MMNYSQISTRADRALPSGLRASAQHSSAYHNSTSKGCTDSSNNNNPTRSGPDSANTASNSSNSAADDASGMFAFIRQMSRLVFYHFVPTFLKAVRVRVMSLAHRVIYLAGRGLHFSIAASLAGWLLLSAWWIAAAVGTGAWAAALFAASIAWIYRLWCSLWPWSSSGATNSSDSTATTSRSIFWWLSYALWPFAWLRAWRHQRLRQRQQQRQHQHRYQQKQSMHRHRRPLAVHSSPSSSESSSSGLPTPSGMTLSPSLPRKRRVYTDNNSCAIEDVRNSSSSSCDDLAQRGLHVHLST